MRQAQIDKMNTLANTTPKENTEKNDLTDIDNKIQTIQMSIVAFEKQITGVLGEKITPEQKQKAQNIIKEKEQTIERLIQIKTELSLSQSETARKKNELNVYKNADASLKNSSEIANKISDLEKKIWELDESEQILLKELGLLERGITINKELTPKEIDALQSMNVTQFLQFSPSDRLRAVTIGNIHADKIKNGEIKNLEINFSFNGRFNRSLYLATTAGMILPEEVRSVTVKGVQYSRRDNAMQGEFFDSNGHRLTIHDGTNIEITKLLESKTLETNFASKLDKKQFSNDFDYYIARESEKRGIDSKVFLTLFESSLKGIEDEKQKVAMAEDLFVEIDRRKGYFFKNFGKSAYDESGKLSAEFLAYLFQDDEPHYKKIAKEVYSYSDEDVKNAYAKTASEKIEYSGELLSDKFSGSDIPKEEIERIRKLRAFPPNSQDAITLLKLASKAIGVDSSWATNPKTHYILGKESNGKVGILNYTIRGMSLESFYKKANSSSSANPIGSTSTASGLGQLLLSNVDKYYPSGRRGIGDPIEEAAGFLAYIKDRYGSPDVAHSVYGRTGSYTHAITGKQQRKGFREGY